MYIKCSDVNEWYMYNSSSPYLHHSDLQLREFCSLLRLFPSPSLSPSLSLHDLQLLQINRVQQLL